MWRKDLTRRDFVKRAGVTLAATGTVLTMQSSAAQEQPEAAKKPSLRRRKRARTEREPAKPVFGERPNILLLESDQHSGSTMSCAGHSVIRTPHMDRLAREGAQFVHAYCPSPLCVPSRVAVLTGRFAHNTGLLTNGGYLLQGEPTFPQALRAAGYRTCITGKIHLAQGAKPGTPECDQRLEGMGFDDTMANSGKVTAGTGEIEDMYRKYLREKGVFDRFREDYLARRGKDRPHWYAEPSVLSEEDFHDTYIGRITNEWLENYKDDKPFFCWCNWGGPHAPWDAPGRYAKMYDPANVDEPIHDSLEGAPEFLRRRQQKQTGGMPLDAWRACRASYYGMINVVDDAIGAMLQTLEKRGMLENTIVIYTSDHGEMLCDHGFFAKGLMYEQSARIPLIIRWPKHFQQGLKSEALTSPLDLVPTFLAVAGSEPMEALHGASLLPVLTGKSASHRDEVFSEMDPMKMLRQGDWKYVYDPVRQIEQLFNLKNDPQELKSLAGSPEVAERQLAMRRHILDWMIETETRPNTTGVRPVGNA